MEPLPKFKACTKCKEVKALAEYSKGKTSKNGIRSACRACTSVATRARYIKNYCPERNKFSSIKSKYGLSKVDYFALLRTQEHKCKICRRDEVDSVHNTLYVDHCHATGKVRALLCDKCNTGLGHFQDSPELLAIAKLYLEEHR